MRFFKISFQHEVLTSLLVINLHPTLHISSRHLFGSPVNCSSFVRASRARSLYKGEAHTTCALCALCSALYCSSQHLAVFLSTWLRASLSEHQCGAGGRERERRRRADRDAGCFWERGRRAGATGDAAALWADGRSLSALRPLGGDAGDPPLLPVRVALTGPAALCDTYVRPFSILFCICISYSQGCVFLNFLRFYTF